MPDSLLYLVLIGAAVAYFWSAKRRRTTVLRGNADWAEGVRVGPLPGYSYMPGEGVRWDPGESPPRGLGETWSVLSAEALHMPGKGGIRRARLVLRIVHRGLSDTDLIQLARTLATRMQRRMRVAVVAIEAHEGVGQNGVVVPDGAGGRGGDAVLLYSPDGGGWTGTARDAFVTVRLPGRDDFRLPA